MPRRRARWKSARQAFAQRLEPGRNSDDARDTRLCAPEAWPGQIPAVVQRQGEVLVYSSLADDVIRAGHLTPCHDVEGAVKEELSRRGGEAQVAVLPQGPLTIPYLG